MNIYIHKDGTQYGPYSLEQVQQYIQQGAFTLQDQACHDGQNWVPLSQVPVLLSKPNPRLRQHLNKDNKLRILRPVEMQMPSLIKPLLHPQRVVRTKLLSLVQLVLLS